MKTLLSLSASLLFIAPLASCLAEDSAPPLYAFQNGTGFGSLEKDAAVLKELGYAGIAQVQDGTPSMSDRISAYEAAGLRVLSVYLNVTDKALAAHTVKPLANRDAMIELTIRKMTPGTVNAVRDTVAMAAEMKIKVALYPHHGFAIATIPQAMELIKKVDHPNLGLMFNLCHFLKGENSDDLETTLTTAAPHLFGVSISGADTKGRGWGQLIQTLDKGDFPQARLQKALTAISFKGPTSLQCYGIKGDKTENLKTSIAAWKALTLN